MNLPSLSPQTTRDVIRIVTTAGLGKDVIDLLERKVSLLAEELDAFRAKARNLEAENAMLRERNLELEAERSRRDSEDSNGCSGYSISRNPVAG